jgi:hypothetical protein
MRGEEGKKKGWNDEGWIFSVCLELSVEATGPIRRGWQLGQRVARAHYFWIIRGVCLLHDDLDEGVGRKIDEE